jgi:hypothetical protein
MRSPSIKALSTLFGDNAKRAKALLTMNRDQLLATPVGLRRFNECYYPPTVADIRMECLNALGDYYGVEAIETKRGLCMYLNAGDTYTPTLVRWNGAYRIACWGDIVEKHGISEGAY